MHYSIFIQHRKNKHSIFHAARWGSKIISYHRKSYCKNTLLYNFSSLAVQFELFLYQLVSKETLRLSMFRYYFCNNVKQRKLQLLFHPVKTFQFITLHLITDM